MGTIARFDLFDLQTKYGVQHFVETGTGTGSSLAHVAKFPFKDAVTSYQPFKMLLSCEIDGRMAQAVIDRFADAGETRVVIFAESSERFLERICSNAPADEPILFWLDAHFPGADGGFGGRAGFGDERDDTVRLPLATELEIIKRHRPLGLDVIACDDLRIYLDGPFAHGNVPPNVRPHCPKNRSIDFAHEIMGSTHDVREFYEHEGYMLLTPKTENSSA